MSGHRDELLVGLLDALIRCIPDEESGACPVCGYELAEDGEGHAHGCHLGDIVQRGREATQ